MRKLAEFCESFNFHIQDVEYYEINTFNPVVAGNIAMLSAGCWSEVHPTNRPSDNNRDNIGVFK